MSFEIASYRVPFRNRRERGSVSQSHHAYGQYLDRVIFSLNPLECLVKMDHIQKEPPLDLKGITGASEGSECGLVSKADIKAGRDSRRIAAVQDEGTVRLRLHYLCVEFRLKRE